MLSFALIRLVINPADYVAIRTLVGIQNGIGPGTCNDIASWLLASGLRYGDVLSWPDLDALSGRARESIRAVRDAATAIAPLDPTLPIEQALESIASGIEAVLGEDGLEAWRNYASDLPIGMTLDETSRLLSAATPRAERAVLSEVRARLGHPTIDEDVPRVRVMTLHSSKGLTFEVVFIPGLERGLLPSWRDMPFPGLVQQAARLLFVGITRARLLVVLSMAQFRMIQGRNEARQATPFIGNLGGRFEIRDSGLTPADVADVVAARIARLS